MRRNMSMLSIKQTKYNQEAKLFNRESAKTRRMSLIDLSYNSRHLEAKE